MVRSAAKNYKSVTVVTDPEDYKMVKEELLSKSETTKELREILAAKAFSYVANYDSLIATFFQKEIDGNDKFISLNNCKRLRYGENPHQEAAFFKDQEDNDGLGLGNFKLLQGKETSYNNYLDLEAGLQTNPRGPY